MKFSEKELFEIAARESRAAGLNPNNDGTAEWAHYSAQEEYADEAAVIAEIRRFIEIEKEFATECGE